MMNPSWKSVTYLVRCECANFGTYCTIFRHSSQPFWFFSHAVNQNSSLQYFHLSSKYTRKKTQISMLDDTSFTNTYLHKNLSEYWRLEVLCFDLKSTYNVPVPYLSTFYNLWAFELNIAMSANEKPISVQLHSLLLSRPCDWIPILPYTLLAGI